MIRGILPALAAIGLLPALVAVATPASAQATNRSSVTGYAGDDDQAAERQRLIAELDE